ncbi:MAG: hypothetical protein Q9227_000703 [Pyrenula ochraceoflavens]
MGEKAPDSKESSDQSKRKRKFHSKRRWGCKTCRARHIKCDETRPACQRCTSTGRTCDYEQATKFLVKSLTTTPQPDRLNPMRFDDPKDGTAFQFFLAQTAVKLNFYSRSQIWADYVPSRSQHPAIRYGMLALGARTLAMQASSACSKDYVVSALQHYGNAIRAVSDPESPLEITMMTALMLNGFQNLFGWSEWINIAGGLKLLSNYRASQPILRGKPNESIVETIGPIFDGMFVHICGSYLATFPCFWEQPPLPYGSKVLPAVPITIVSASQASRCLNGIISFFTFNLENPILRSRPSEPAFGKDEVDYLLRQWSAAFEQFYWERRNIEDTFENNFLLLLRIQHRTLSVIHAYYKVATETAFDACTEGFQAVVSQSRSLLASKNSATGTDFNDFCLVVMGSSKPFSRRSENFEPFLGLIPSLFLAATRCRDPRLRREALHLLRVALNLSSSLATLIAWHIAERIIKIEEKGRTIHHASDVPETERVRLIMAAINGPQDSFTMRYTFCGPKPEGVDLEEFVKEDTIPWLENDEDRQRLDENNPVPKSSAMAQPFFTMDADQLRRRWNLSTRTATPGID